MNTLYNYYQTKYGKPAREAEFISPDGKKVEILKWPPNQTSEGVSIYTTLGASSLLGNENESCEFFLGLSPDADSIAQALAEVAVTGNGSSNIPNSGDSLSLSYELWQGTKANSFLFTNGDEIIPPVTIKNKKIFSSELKFKKAHGEKMFWSLFESQSIPYWSSNRTEAAGMN
jgi:hypothetical protein